MGKKNIIRTTRVKCSDGLFHRVDFHPDGTVLSNGCGDVTQEAARIAGLLRLAKAPSEVSTCACLAALVLHGCEIILRREPNEDNEVPITGWREIYIRFETNKLVEQTMNRWRRKLRKERKERRDQALKAIVEGAAQTLPDILAKLLREDPDSDLHKAFVEGDTITTAKGRMRIVRDEGGQLALVPENAS